MAKVLRAVALAAAASTLALSTPAVAEDYFKDKTVTVVVPSGSGGSFHIYCQIVTEHLGKHIPGKPQTIIQNRPGAGGVNSLRWMMTAAPKDGTVIAMINPDTNITTILRPLMDYHLLQLRTLGSC